MKVRDIANARLANQQIASSSCTTAREVVAHLTAVQAQDYRGALWSIGLRLPGSTQAQIEKAIADRTIVRTWPMRGTLHFVAAPDIRWMLRLLAPRAIKRAVGRMRQLELDDAVLQQSRKAIMRALRDGHRLTREELYGVLERAKISPANQRGIHILSRLSHDGLLCFASHRGKQPTFALLDAWIPESRDLARDAALGELTSRYFRGHGPATVRDFSWWSGLTLGDARAGVSMVSSELLEETIAGVVYLMSRDATGASDVSRALYLLPGFDELLLGYQDRSVTLAPSHADMIVPGKNGMFLPTIVAGGRVVGTWKAVTARGKTSVTPAPFAPLSTRDARAFAAAAKRYQRFVE